MMRFRILIPFLLLFTAACSQTETTIVRTPAIVQLPNPDADERDLEARPSSTLRMAELTGVESFDPLIARTSSDFRKIQLVYEGLTRLNASGKPVLALASQIDISSDSLIYTVRLRDNAFFHNDPTFSNGIGRKVNANDVIAAFERMTRRDVPETAAKLFNTTIIGFDLRNRENRDIYVPSLRQTTGIAGIERVDSRTIRFSLIARDRWFLHRLASPLAVIYAPESMPVMGQRPVGSGPYRYQSSSADTLVTFLLNSAHPDTSQFRIRRVDVRRAPSETRAYRSLMLREADVIAESGPVLATGIRELNSELVNVIPFQNADQVSIRFNPSNLDELTLLQSIGWFNMAWSDSLNREFRNSGYDMTFLATNGSKPSIFTSAFKLTDYPHEDQLSRRMVLHLRKTGNVDLLKGYAVSREVTFHTISLPRHIPRQEWVTEHDLVRFDIRGYRLSHPGVEGLTTAPHSWWFDLRGVSLTR
jgi:ABC-type transport system substrate-binding protein